MRNDERFEIERAFDLLPYVVGQFGSNLVQNERNQKPSREEFREKTLEYLKKAELPLNPRPDDDEFAPSRNTLILEKMKNMRKRSLV